MSLADVLVAVVVVACLSLRALAKSERVHIAAWGAQRSGAVASGAYRTPARGALTFLGPPPIVRRATRLGVVVGCADIVLATQSFSPPAHPWEIRGIREWFLALTIPAMFVILGCAIIVGSFRLARCGIGGFAAPASVELSAGLHTLVLLFVGATLLDGVTASRAMSLAIALAALEHARLVHRSLPAVRDAVL
jgi:hypothetical protein